MQLIGTELTDNEKLLDIVEEKTKPNEHHIILYNPMQNDFIPVKHSDKQPDVLKHF